jgi:hypothetical protein
LVVWAIQAVDGTKIEGNAAKDRTLDAAALAKLLERVETAIADLEAQNRPDGPPTPPRLPEDLRAAILVKSRTGIVAGFNAQAVAAAVAFPPEPGRPGRPTRPGRVLTAVDVVAAADDHGQLVPMVERVEAVTARTVDTLLSEGGYHDGATVAACADRGQQVVMPEAQTKELAKPYHKDRFVYDPATDAYTCPEGKVLTRHGEKARTDRPVVRVYRAEVAICRDCPAFGVCTKDGRQGRALEVGPHETALRDHRTWMASEEAQTLARQRKTLIEPVFGVLKEELGARRFLLRGLAGVRAEWTLLATAFNLRTCVRLWQQNHLAA